MLGDLWDGKDPTEERRAARAAKPPTVAAKAPSFRSAAQDYFNRKVRGRINARDEGKWMSDLELFAFAFIGDVPVDQITTKYMMAIADQPHVRYGGTTETRLWESVPERASRCFKKIELILAAETRLGHRSGDNPAQWRGHLADLPPKPSSVRPTKHHNSLPHEQLPAFMAALRAREPSLSSRALEFLILTAARSGEVYGATWGEIDLKRGLWTIPAARMGKGKREHRVALPAAAVAILKATPRFAKTDRIWPGEGLDGKMTDPMRQLMQRMHAAEVKAGRAGWLDPKTGGKAVPHGFWSTFRDWAAEHGFDRDMAELALSHDVASAVERAYRRTDMLERRRALMEDWAAHALSEVGAGLRAVG